MRAARGADVIDDSCGGAEPSTQESERFCSGRSRFLRHRATSLAPAVARRRADVASPRHQATVRRAVARLRPGRV
jgi:hypothetical protein